MHSAKLACARENSCVCSARAFLYLATNQEFANKNGRKQYNHMAVRALYIYIYRECPFYGPKSPLAGTLSLLHNTSTRRKKSDRYDDNIIIESFDMSRSSFSNLLGEHVIYIYIVIFIYCIYFPLFFFFFYGT